jgi:hypothetical protein
MDTTQIDHLIQELSLVDPADAPDLVDAVAEALLEELETDQEEAST